MRVLANGVQIGSVNPAGAASVVVNVTPPLAVGQQITARQTVNTFESANSIAIAVGTLRNSSWTSVSPASFSRMALKARPHCEFNPQKAKSSRMNVTRATMI